MTPMAGGFGSQSIGRTRARLEAAGCEVRTFDGEEIARKGNGGPTCLTRPLHRR